MVDRVKERLQGLLEDFHFGFYRCEFKSGLFLDACQLTAEQLGFASREALLASDAVLQDLFELELEWGELLARLEAQGKLRLRAQLKGRPPRVVDLRLRHLGTQIDGLWEVVEEDELFQSDMELFQSVIETLPVGVNITDETGQVRYVNQSAANLLGLSQEQYRSRSIKSQEWRAFDAEGRALTVENFPGVVALEEEREVRDVELMIESSEGERAWLSVNAVPLKTSGLGVALTFSEITALKENELHFRAIFDDNLSVMLLVDPRSGQIIRANEAAASFYGYSVDELKAKTIYDINTKARPEIDADMARALAGVRKAFHFEHRLACGDHRAVEVYSSPVIYGGQKILFSIIHDVTQRVRNRQLLVESEKRFHEITSSMQDIVFVLDEQQRHLGFYGPWAEREGVDPELFMGRTAEEIFGRHTAKPHSEAAERALQGEFVVYDWSYDRGHGRVHFQTSLSPIIGDGGKVNGVVAIGRNITELVKAKEEIKKREVRYRAILDGTGDGLFLTDGLGRFEDVNAAACEMTGYSRDELMGMEVADLDPMFTQARVIALNESLQPGDSLSVVGEHRRKDKSRYPVEIGVSCFVLGTEKRFICSARDITGRMKAEEEQFEIQRALIELQKAESLSILAGGVAHDFNNLLMGVLGNIEIALSEMSLSSEHRELLEEVQNAAEQASELGRQMLAYSGRRQLDVELVNPNQVLREMEPSMRALSQHRVTFRFELDDSLPGILVDLTQLRQIIQNLVVNASEACGSQGAEIQIRTRWYSFTRACPWSGKKEHLREGRYLLIELSDNGSGISPGNLSRIFEPFFSTKFTGRGLGLAASQGIMSSHNGAILATSEPDKGTTFYLLFPEATSQGLQPETQSQPVDIQAKRVLLVDDEPVVLRVATRMLQRLGFDVVPATNGLEALSYLGASGGGVDLVILDVLMPVKDGPTTLTEIRNTYGALPVLLASGYSKEEALEQLHNHVPNGFIQKPFQMKALKSKLEAVLDCEL